MPGELDAMRELARAFLTDCEGELNSGEACVALRIAGVTKWFAGEFVEARDFFERRAGDAVLVKNLFGGVENRVARLFGLVFGASCHFVA